MQYFASISPQNIGFLLTDCNCDLLFLPLLQKYEHLVNVKTTHDFLLVLHSFLPDFFLFVRLA
jgi:hypothetical protein